MIPFQCPHCGLQTRVDAQFAGQSGPCAGCGQMIAIPKAPTDSHRDRRPSRSPKRMTVALGLAAVALTLFLLMGVFRQVVQPTLRSVQRSAQRHRCENRVQRLIHAMYAYQADQGHFPPAYSVDPQGVPLHSWRVLLLPYLGPEAKALHAQLRLIEPWNSSHNRAFAPLVPDVLVCPHDRPFAIGDTSYCVPVGEAYAFQPGHGLASAEFTDSPASTMLIVEAHNSGINWMRPADVTAAELAHGINSGVPGTCGSHHQGETITIGTLDGQSRQLSSTTSPEVLDQMATVTGSESPQPLFTP